jgi:hypothetical protein
VEQGRAKETRSYVLLGTEEEKTFAEEQIEIVAHQGASLSIAL